LLTISNKLNDTIFQKTLAINDFYWGTDEFQFPMGHIQLLGKANADMLKGDAPPYTPKFVLEGMAQRSIDWWLTAEDLPHPENRVTLKNGMIKIIYKPNNQEAIKMLKRKWKQVLRKINKNNTLFDIMLDKDIPLAGVAHQCGTMRFGNDPETSVLDSNCKMHELTNVYVVDGSFMPSSAAVNPSLTIMANAIRVGEHLTQNL
jgi:choline dehydrogenase-like flavoprotein